MQVAQRVDPGLFRANFHRVASTGFGDPLNAYPHSMAWFQDHLYVGTTRANLANRALQIAQKTPERLGAVWPVPVPQTHWDNDLAAQIWRYHPPTDNWTKLYTAPRVLGIDGFEVPLSVGFRSMTTFQGESDNVPALYVPTWGSHQTPTSFMLRSEDGVSFEVVSEPARALPEDRPRALRGLVGFRGRLFASPVIGQNRLEPNVARTMVILVTTDPARDEAWRQACPIQFGDPNNVSCFDLAEFNGYLYAGTLNVQEGFQLWKTDAEGQPPYRWKRVLSGGAGRGKFNQMAMTLTAFKDHLYVGTAIQNCSFDYDNNVGPAPPELLRVGRDDSWELVFGDPRITPDGLKVPISGMGAGLNNPYAGYLWSMCVHDGWLYVGTAVWAVFLRYSGRADNWPKGSDKGRLADDIERLLHHSGGCDYWRTRDGYHWVPVTQNGFENCFNIGIRSQVSTPYGLFVGTANPFGPEVAVRRHAGWVYETNPRGGLEIWCGSRDHTPPREPRPRAYGRGPLEITISRSVARPARKSIRAMIARFYGGADYLHTGYWTAGITSAEVACDNLVAEVSAFLRGGDAIDTIVEIASRPGATTERLRELLPLATVAALEGEWHRWRGDSLNGAGEGHEVPEGSIDAVVWVAGFAPLGDRGQLLDLARGLLRPGGRLACFDFLPVPTVPAGRRRREGPVRRVTPQSFEGYRGLLARFGFEDIQVIDVTRATLDECRRRLAGFLAAEKLSCRCKGIGFPQVQETLERHVTPARYGVLISARKAPHGTRPH